MNLLQKLKTFTNDKGEVISFYVYVVEVFGREIELKPVKISDKSLLEVGFKNGKK